MPLVIPKIDDRGYAQILAEALARIPVHNPEWTNFNDSDPGVTLVQLFAFMTESLLYRSNLIPERNRLKFLQLLGIPLRPAAAARGIVAFSTPKGAPQTVTLPAGIEVAAGRVPFRTLDGLDVLPIDASIYYKSPLPEERKAEVESLYNELYSDMRVDGSSLAFYETKPLEAPASGTTYPVLDLSKTQDGAVWIALLAKSKEVVKPAREAIANKVLALGILPSLTDASRVLLPGGRPSAENQPRLVYELPKLPPGGALPAKRELRVATYRPVPDATPTDDVTVTPGVVQILLPGEEELGLWTNLEPREEGSGDFPPFLEDTSVSARLITWLRVRLPEAKANSGVASTQVSVQLSWLGVNAARVTQLAHVSSESPGQGTGEPDQVLTLVNRPVIPDSVRLSVNGELWKEIDDLSAAAPEVPVRSPRLTPGAQETMTTPEEARVFTVDRESGEIRFGDGLHGARPPADAVIQASYDYGGGTQGNVGIGAINKGATLPAGLKVVNPIPTWGGDEAETAAEGERRIPLYLQHRDRAVSAADFAEITAQTPGVDIGRIEVLPLFHPDLGSAPAEGVVTVLVIPRNDPAQPDAPEPDRLFLDTVCRYLDPRRVVTTEVHVRGPDYVKVWVSIGFEVVPGRDLAPVREAVKAAIRAFLSPLTGGFDGAGWPLQKSVEKLELWAVATRVDGVSKVTDVLLGDEAGDAKDRVPMAGLELPWLIGLSVQSGEPQELAELRGDTKTGDTTAAPTVVAIPVIPPEC
jgi:hypothetical protein